MSQSNVPTTVYYHANCMDGFGAAWAFNQFFPSAAIEYIPVQYGDVPTVKEGIIYILDFSFSREVLKDICANASSVTLLDHHKTAQTDLENWPDKPFNLHIVFDMNRSGAGITWDYFASDQKRPALINYIEDRDLWKFSLVESKEINALIANTPKTFADYDALNKFIGYQTEEAATIGNHLMKQHDNFCSQIAQEARSISFHLADGEICNGLAVNCTYQFASEVGSLLAKLSGTFGASYFYDKNGSCKWSLRSGGDYDVSRIAKEFKGGGHKNAAGFITGTGRREMLNIYSPLLSLGEF